jgi:hypothetical protein
VLRDPLRGDQSSSGIVEVALEVKFGIAGAPPVDAWRPAACPRCDAPSRVPGQPLGLHGHGLRGRQLRGPRRPEAEPEVAVVEARRYQCRHCGAVVTVAPAAATARRHYSRPAIALALARFGLLGEPAAQVRRRVSPWRTVGAAATGSWVTLKRWARAVAEGRLRLVESLVPAGRTLRELAGYAAQMVVGAAPPAVRHRDLAAQAFYGALAAV